MVKFKYEAFGFKFETVQLLDIVHTADGSAERVVASTEHVKLRDSGEIKFTGAHVTLSISHGDQRVFVPLLETGPIK
jgi:hypothetical protein